MSAISDSLESVFALEDGWLDGDAGRAVTVNAKERAANIAEGLTEEHGDVSVFPTEEGGVRFFWAESASRLSVDVEPNGDVCLHAAGMNPGIFQYVVLTEGESLGEYLTRGLA